MQTVRTNLTNNASTQYSNFDFQSMCLFNGAILGAGANGLFKLCCGTDDDGVAISAYFITRHSILDWKGNKRIRRTYLRGSSDGNVVITPIIDDVSGIAVTFQPDATGKFLKSKTGRKDERGIYWQFKVENYNGATLEVDNIDILTVPMSIGYNR